MRKEASLESISDGKLYDSNSIVKVDAIGCESCSACCHNVGDLIELSPYDVYKIKQATKKSFDDLLFDKVELRTNNKITLPFIKMQGDSKRCSFLNDLNRCDIHENRPNICRLFPLGRVYEGDDFMYFLQVNACVKDNLQDIKIEKWLGIDRYEENKAFIMTWYNLIKALNFRVKFIHDEQELKSLNEHLLNVFYHTQTDDFYKFISKAIQDVKPVLGIL